MNNIECKDFLIPTIQANFEQLENGKQSIGIQTSFNILIPKDAENKENIVSIKASFIDKDKNNILAAKIQGKFILLDDTIISSEEKNKLLEKEAIPFLYGKFQKYIDKVLELSNVKFVGLPPYENI